MEFLPAKLANGISSDNGLCAENSDQIGLCERKTLEIAERKDKQNAGDDDVDEYDIHDGVPEGENDLVVCDLRLGSESLAEKLYDTGLALGVVLCCLSVYRVDEQGLHYQEKGNYSRYRWTCSYGWYSAPCNYVVRLISLSDSS